MADPKHPHHYDEAFKRQIVQLYANGKPSRETGAEYDIARSTPRRWVQAIRNSGSTRADVQVFRTDRGSEFDNTRIDELLDVFGIKRSLSRKGNPYDNAVVESTNRLLKKELVYRNSYATIEQLRRDLDDYVWWSDDQRSTPPSDTGVRRNSPNKDSSSRKLSNTPLPIHSRDTPRKSSGTCPSRSREAS